MREAISPSPPRGHSLTPSEHLPLQFSEASVCSEGPPRRSTNPYSPTEEAKKRFKNAAELARLRRLPHTSSVIVNIRAFESLLEYLKVSYIYDKTGTYLATFRRVGGGSKLGARSGLTRRGAWDLREAGRRKMNCGEGMLALLADTHDLVEKNAPVMCMYELPEHE